MIGILIATHGNFGEGIISGVELIAGKQEDIMSLGLCHGDGIDEFVEKISSAIISLDKGDGVIVFVDLFGASPYNAAAISSKKVGNVKFKCITGVNLPMLLEAIVLRDSYDLEKLTNKILECGQSGIKELFNELNKYNQNN